MYTVALFGAGKIGHAICGLLSLSGRYQVRVCDVDEVRAREVASSWGRCTAHKLNLDQESFSAALLDGCHAVISALPFFCNRQVAQLAAKKGLHYLDLTEDVRVTKEVITIAEGSKGAFLPQCGLAPGFISIAATHLVNQFETVDSVKMRVGALPVFPTNMIKYNLTWSTDGLINEYGNMCEAIVDGKLQQVLPLEGYEKFSLDGVEYEAFNTSGGLGSMCETMLSRVKDLSYKTIRYPGHRDLIFFLMNELRFNQDRETLRQVFERSIPTTSQDECVILVEVKGQAGTKYKQSTYSSKVYSAKVGNHHLSAIQITTAAGVCAPLDLLLTEKLGIRRGFLKCEEIPFFEFLGNEFGKYYQDERAIGGIAR